MKKAVIIDLDGTLFNNHRAVSDVNRAVLRRCRELGILIIIATARPLRTVMHCIPAETYDDYIVLCNGAWIVRRSKVLLRNELPPAVVKTLVEKLLLLGYAPAIEANDCFYTDGKLAHGFIDSYFPLHSYSDVAACKVLAYVENGVDAQRVARALGADVSYVITDNNTLLQISAPDCSKLSACITILQAEGISLAGTYAFGDDNNDISLFEAVGCGIAMANGTSALQGVAKYITESNENDGVAKGILKYVLTVENSA